MYTQVNWTFANAKDGFPSSDPEILISPTSLDQDDLHLLVRQQRNYRVPSANLSLPSISIYAKLPEYAERVFGYLIIWTEPTDRRLAMHCFSNTVQPVFDRLIAADNQWVLHDNPKRKMQWLSPNDSPRSAAKPTPKRRFCVCFWNIRGIARFEVLKPGHSVNADLCKLDRVNQA